MGIRGSSEAHHADDAIPRKTLFLFRGIPWRPIFFFFGETCSVPPGLPVAQAGCRVPRRRHRRFHGGGGPDAISLGVLCLGSEYPLSI